MSDQDNTIFSSDPAPTPTQDPTPAPVVKQEPVQAPAADPYADLLKGITTEDGRQKYATASDAINALPHAQAHINKLEQEAREMKEALAKAQGVEAVLEKLQQAQPQDNPPQGGLTEQSAVELMNQVILDNQAKAAREANRLETNAAMVAKFGDKAAEVLVSRGTQLGLDKVALKNMAETSPAAFKELFGIGKEVQTVTNHLESSLNTQVDPLQNKSQEPVKNVMFGATKADINNAWKLAGDLAAQK